MLSYNADIELRLAKPAECRLFPTSFKLTWTHPDAIFFRYRLRNCPIIVLVYTKRTCFKKYPLTNSNVSFQIFKDLAREERLELLSVNSKLYIHQSDLERCKAFLSAPKGKTNMTIGILGCLFELMRYVHNEQRRSCQGSH